MVLKRGMLLQLMTGHSRIAMNWAESVQDRDESL